MILRKIVKIAAIRCHILKLKCIKFDFDWDSTPDPAGGAYCSAPPDLLAGFKGPTFKGWGGEDKGGQGTGLEGKGEGKGRRGGKG